MKILSITLSFILTTYSMAYDIAKTAYKNLAQIRPFPTFFFFKPLPVNIIINAFDNLQTKYNSASCGDTLLLQAGATWDTIDVDSAFIFNKACTSNSTLTIKSSVNLPNVRVSPSNVSSMARIRAKGRAGAITFNDSGAYHILEGLEVTNVGNDSSNEIIRVLITASNTSVSNITIQKSYIHPKETGTDYTRSVEQAYRFEGSFTTFRWNYASGFFGRIIGDSGVPTTRIILCVICNNLNVIDNYLEAWYTAIFTGGGDEPPQYTATVTSSSITSGTFSSTTGLSANKFLRFKFTGAMNITSSSASCTDHIGGNYTDCRVATWTAGQSQITSDDVDHSVWLTPVDGSGVLFRGRISIVSGTTITMAPFSTGVVPNGNYTYELFEVANVTNIASNVVTFEAIGTNGLKHVPDSNATVAWRTDPLVHDINILRNTFNIDYDHALFEHNLSNQSPKGWIEAKSGTRIRWEGNIHTGYASTLGFGQYSNEGTTPWTKLKDIDIVSNFINTIKSVAGSDYQAARSFITGHLDDPYNTTEPGSDVDVYNNLIIGCAVLMHISSYKTVKIEHNTLINDQNPDSSLDFFPSMMVSVNAENTGWIYKNNIAFNNDAGPNCQVGAITTCWPAILFQANIIVNNYNQSSGHLTSVYGSGILAPFGTTLASIGFVNTAAGTVAGYALATDSNYKNDATDGTDPGINVSLLQNALSSATPTKCNWNTNPVCN